MTHETPLTQERAEAIADEARALLLNPSRPYHHNDPWSANSATEYPIRLTITIRGEWAEIFSEESWDRLKLSTG